MESFGAHGIVVTKNEDIARALEEAKHVADQGRPVLVNVHIGTLVLLPDPDLIVLLIYLTITTQSDYYHAGRTDFRKDSLSM